MLVEDIFALSELETIRIMNAGMENDQTLHEKGGPFMPVGPAAGFVWYMVNKKQVVIELNQYRPALSWNAELL